VWAEKVQQGKCAYVGWPLAQFFDTQHPVSLRRMTVPLKPFSMS
jgi:hypothetical protein